MNSTDMHVASPDVRDDRLPLRRPWQLLGQIAGSIALDAALLAMFAHAGTISYDVAVWYAVVAGGCVVVFHLLLHSAWAARQPDPALTRSQILTSSAVEIGFAVYAPAMAFYFFNILFLIFAFGALRLRLAQMLTSFVIVTLAGVLARVAIGEQLTIPGTTPAEQLLVWLGHATILLRCCVVGWQGNRLRRALRDRNDELVLASQRIAHLATHDSLTGSLRRGAIWQLIDERKHEPGLCVVMLDVDHFKAINDRYGHATGDAVLQAFADAVRSAIRPDDLFGRYGGEEFMLMLRAASPQAGLRAAERVRRAVAAFDWSRIAEGLQVTVSGGVAATAPDSKVEALVAAADRALYAAKQAGRDRVLLALPDGRFEPVAD